MYDELVKRLRGKARLVREYNDTGMLEDKAADAIEELQSQLPKWIPVAERYPEKEKVVICLCIANIVEALYLDNDEHWQGYYRRYKKRFVTHWMPLPEAPKEETDG